MIMNAKHDKDKQKGSNPIPSGTSFDPNEEVLKEIQHEQMQELYNEEVLKPIQDEMMKELYEEEVLKPIHDEMMKDIYRDELNAIIQEDIAGAVDPYLSQVVSDAKEKKLDQDIIKEFRSAKARKTTRTTFSLAQRTMQILEKLEKQYGYSPRMVFQEAAELPVPEESRSKGSLGTEGVEIKRTRKTFVIDSNTLQIFNENAAKLNIPRDNIVDAHVAALYHLLVEANQAEMNLAARYRDLAIQLDGRLSEIGEKASADFGSDDHPVANSFALASVHLMNISIMIDKFLSEGVWEEV
jgi:hypothetical protein